MNITYLFGAGASYNSIPIVDELSKAFKEVRLWNSRLNLTPEEKIKLSRAQGVFDSLMNISELNSKIYGTIDTFAKKLYINGDKGDLNHLKAGLSLFFTLWQESKLEGRDMTSVRNSPKVIADIDSRYLGLLTNYLKRENDRVSIYDNVKFLTWNYDTQLERALALIEDKTVDDIIAWYDIYPFSEKRTPSIVHLNGVAGYYGHSNGTGHLYLEKNPIGSRDPVIVLKNLLFFIDSIERREISIGKNFTFAWENEKDNQAIKFASDILQKTDALVIIGYSFPNFNNDVDKELFSVLKNNHREIKIYYQGPLANKSLISKRFGIIEDLIEIENTNYNQFLLPLER